MAFIPLNDSSGNTVIGQSTAPLEVVGGLGFGAGGIYQTYSLSQNWTDATFYEVTPRNWLSPDIPILVVGTLSLNAFPWYIKFAFTYRNIQQNGSSQTSQVVGCFGHGASTYYLNVGQITTYYADGVAPIKLSIRTSYNYFSNVYGTMVTDIYRLGV